MSTYAKKMQHRQQTHTVNTTSSCNDKRGALMGMGVGEFCNREVVITDPSTSVDKCAELMRKHHVGSVVVVEPDGELNIPIGIITDRDIVIQIVASGTIPEEVQAADLISRKLVVAQEVDGLWETMRRMRNNGVRRMPVVNDENVLVGILTVDDLLDILSNELKELVSLVSIEQRKEQEVRSVP